MSSGSRPFWVTLYFLGHLELWGTLTFLPYIYQLPRSHKINAFISPRKRIKILIQIWSHQGKQCQDTETDTYLQELFSTPKYCQQMWFGEYIPQYNGGCEDDSLHREVQRVKSGKHSHIIIDLSVHLPTYLSIYLYLCISISLSVYIYLSTIYPSVYICPSTIYPSVYIYLSTIYPSVYLSFYISIHLSISIYPLSIHLIISIYPLSIHLSISIYPLSIHLSISIYLSILYQYVYLSFYLSIYLSI